MGTFIPATGLDPIPFHHHTHEDHLKSIEEARAEHKAREDTLEEAVDTLEDSDDDSKQHLAALERTFPSSEGKPSKPIELPSSDS